MRWQTKRIQIDSADLQWDGSEEALAVIRDFVPAELIEYRYLGALPTGKALRVYNVLEEQWLKVPFGHWVVKGLKDEFYPIEPDAMDKKYFEVEENNESVNLLDLIRGLENIGDSLAGSYYIKESDMVDMGEYLLEMAKKLKRHGVR